MRLADDIIRFLFKKVKAPWFFAGMLILFATAVAVFSWNCDDAYHGFVMARNLAEGHGFVYNIGERVNASTCPLFDIILAGLYFVFGHMETVSVVFCFLCSVSACAIVLYRVCTHRWHAAFAVLSFLMCTGFMSYTTGGLENSLLFLICAVYLSIVFSDSRYGFSQLLFLSLLCSASLMTRLDSAFFLAVPTACMFLFRRRCSFRDMLAAGFAGLIPFLSWECFSLIYYGFFFPNTYYAKVSTGFPVTDYLIRGCSYTAVSCMFDTVMAFVVVTAVIMSFRSRDIRFFSVASGVLIKIVYIIRVGGDFMVGRYFAGIFFVSVMLIIYADRSGVRLFNRYDNSRALPVMLLSCMMLLCVTRPLAEFAMFDPVSGYNGITQITDERRAYFPYTSSLSRIRCYISGKEDPVNAAWDDTDVRSAISSGMHGSIFDIASGILVYRYGDRIYMQDRYALGDPLLVHLPASRSGHWRTGHMQRDLPSGYEQSLACGQNMISDSDLHAFYDNVLSITRDPVLSHERLRRVADMNLGRYDSMVDRYVSHTGNG